MSIASLPSIASSCAAPLLGALQQATGAPSSSSASGSSASTFAGILAGLGNAANPLNFIATPASASSDGGQSTSILGELSSLLSSV